MTLLASYSHAVKRGDIVDDAHQREILQHFEHLLQNLKAKQPVWLSKMACWLGWKDSLRGIYLYGSVGAGKTFLMDLFFQAIPDIPKKRMHFHHFMQQIDQQLRQLQGTRDPIKKIAQQVAKTTRLLCLDEFLVQDVAHAMMLAQLLHYLFAEGVVIVTTANTRPDDLYSNGVHRERFLPAITLLKTYCKTLTLVEEYDYRRGRSSVPIYYFYPLNTQSRQNLAAQFLSIAGHVYPNQEIEIQQRPVQVLKYSDRAVWFEFDKICQLPRCQLDYLEIASRFETVCISDLPILTEDDTTRVFLLIHFVDVMYDRGVRLLISAAGPLSELYLKGPMLNTFQRTLSRLEEMQGATYLHRHAYHQQSGLM